MDFITTAIVQSGVLGGQILYCSEIISGVEMKTLMAELFSDILDSICKIFAETVI